MQARAFSWLIGGNSSVSPDGLAEQGRVNCYVFTEVLS